MRAGLIAKKIGMSSMFNDQGERLTLTLLKLDDCQVVDHRTVEKNGYSALVVGARKKRASKVSKPEKGFFAKVEVEPKEILREFRVSEDNMLSIGSDLKPSHFAEGQYVDVSAKSIGKGFAGGMKRWGFRGLEATHGVSISHRSHGSTGQCQDPGKVFKGKKMAGHMGDRMVTIQNLKVVSVDDQAGIIIVSGNIPGPKGGSVILRDAVKKAANIW